MDEPKLFPAWRQAEVELLANGATYGSLVTTDWLREAFGIKEAATVAQYQRNELVMLRQTQALSESLLENHRMMLVPVRGVGYTIVPPEKQTAVAMDRRTKEIKQALMKMAREISFVNVEKLTDAQRKENSDAQAKIGALRGLVRKQLKSE